MKKLFLFAFVAVALVACNNSATPTDEAKKDSTATSATPEATTPATPEATTPATPEATTPATPEAGAPAATEETKAH